MLSWDMRKYSTERFCYPKQLSTNSDLIAHVNPSADCLHITETNTNLTPEAYYTKLVEQTLSFRVGLELPKPNKSNLISIRFIGFRTIIINIL